MKFSKKQIIFPFLLHVELRLWKGGFNPRVGVIIDCPQKDFCHHLVKVILTSRMAVSEMVDHSSRISYELVV